MWRINELTFFMIAKAESDLLVSRSSDRTERGLIIMNNSMQLVQRETRISGRAIRTREAYSVIPAARILFSSLTLVLLMLSSRAQAAPRFHLEDATIEDVHRAFRAKQLTATQLVQLYLKRIEAYNGRCVQGA